MKIAIVGANGQLGSDLVRAFTNNGDAVVALTHQQIELADADSVSRVIREIQPQVIVNTAAMHHVERCEEHPDIAYRINALGPRNLARIASERSIVLMQVSTDYVFSGAKQSPYEENDPPAPLNVYGNTKLAGEYFVRCMSERHFILRTSALYGENPCRAKGLNFVDLMLKLARERVKVRVVDSERVTPTSTAELARQIVALSRSDRYGLYHATAEGSCSWHEFAREIFALAEINAQLEIAAPGEFPSKVSRPCYSVLENRALAVQGLNLFRPWQAGLQDYIRQIRKCMSIAVS
jgi:dTDP-4-dehydrorhamnose reductase